MIHIQYIDGDSLVVGALMTSKAKARNERYWPSLSLAPK